MIPKLDGPFDFVFIDALKEEYLDYFRAVVPKLRPRAIIVADNVIQFADEMQDFFAAVRPTQSASRSSFAHEGKA